MTVALVAKAGIAFKVWAVVAVRQLAALGPLLRVDGYGTARSFGLMFARVALAALPAVLLIRAVPPRRRVWLIPTVALLVVASSPPSLASCATAAGWVLLIALSAGAAALVLRRVPWTDWTAALPFLVLLSPVPGHVLAARRSADAQWRQEMSTDCSRRAGRRPANFSADLVKPAYGISVLGEDLVLLTGQGPDDGRALNGSDRRPGSWWLRRREGQLVFDRPSAVQGCLWRGCALDGALWIGMAGGVVGARRAGDEETVTRFDVPTVDMDVGDTACDPVRRRLYVGEASEGAVWEVDPSDGSSRRIDLGRVALLPVRRFDDALVVGSSSELIVLSSDDRRVVERVPSALLSVGLALCGSDGAAAVADEAGRLRVFTLDARNHYQFAWGATLFAPRRVAWSGDCSRIAVTSSDDHSVFIVDAASHRVLQVLRAGPALREITATGPREFLVADACSVTSFSL
ncbi:MAG TPA: hypothetical protein VN903_25670 [Polyangia bacterium]|nr:hypothetical protein [Polyangia bacterium]